ncbi:MAG: hypothetical protein HY869_21075 [Chloroflexi bacterium]|nr:hypothetical protein [Chloroflexota bacterium]
MNSPLSWLNLQIAKIDPRHIQLALTAFAFVVFLINGPSDDPGGFGGG